MIVILLRTIRFVVREVVRSHKVDNVIFGSCQKITKK